MRTIGRAQDIVTFSPKEALSDAVGLAVVVLLIFAGFTMPAFF